MPPEAEGSPDWPHRGVNDKIWVFTDSRRPSLPRFTLRSPSDRGGGGSQAEIKEQPHAKQLHMLAHMENGVREPWHGGSYAKQIAFRSSTSSR
jgi:hypothetical protein